ncbi:hypothetical protein [Isorropodon fossajaponicum symbiont]|nr:hypothetical protein [Isorropodon fossajaponicum symbiont]
MKVTTLTQLIQLAWYKKNLTNTLNFASSNDGDSGLIVFGNTSVSLTRQK